MAGQASSIEWHVDLTRRQGSTSWGQRPRGRVHISSESRGEETLVVPTAVARLLDTQQASGEFKPSSRAELLYHLHEVCVSQAMRRVVTLVDRRDYSSTELSTRLRDDGYRPDVVDEVVGRAVDSGLVDDRRFADVFVRSKVAAGWGMRRIAQELRQRGILVDELPGWPYEYLDPDDEAARAQELAQRHHVSGKNQFPKLVRFLVGRGFSQDVAYDAARSALYGTAGEVY